MSSVNSGRPWPNPTPTATPTGTPHAAATTAAPADQPLVLRSSARAGAGAYVPRRILVLGATSGIAEACCRLWADRGDSLHLIGRNPARLNAVAADVRTRGAAFVGTTVADLEDTRAHPEMLAHAINALGGLDIAFFAHGVLGDQGEAERSFAAAGAILHNNLTSMVSLLTWLANYCVQRHAGTLAVLSSVAGDRGRKYN